MSRKSRKPAPPTAALEICSRHVHFAVVEPDSTSGRFHARTRSLEWRKQATSLHGELARQELATAIAKLVGEEKLRGLAMHVALSRDFCVTRVVTGRASHVRQELKELEQRAGLYLSLGAGRKSVATTVAALDARHEYALAAVANERVIDGLLAILAEAGVRPGRVQPSLLALSRVLGRARRDADAPQLMVNLAEGSLELGISYRGQLLLDYCPGGRENADDVADIVAHHGNRLERYCARCLRQVGAPAHAARLTGGYLFGSAEAVQAAQASFRRWGGLDMEVFDPLSINADWKFDRSRPGTEHVAALGSCLDAGDAPAQGYGPNFMDRVIARQRAKLLPLVLRNGWPVAAMLLLSVLGYGLNVVEQARCTELAHRMEEHEPARAATLRLQADIHRADVKTEHLRGIRQALVNPAWDNVLETIAHCLPDNVWLNRLEAGSQRNLTLSGASYGDEAAYELVRWLDQAPGMHDVQLEAMQSRRLATGPTTTFDVKLNLASAAGDASRKDRP